MELCPLNLVLLLSGVCMRQYGSVEKQQIELGTTVHFNSGVDADSLSPSVLSPEVRY